MLFLEPLYQFLVHNYANRINHFPLVRLTIFSIDKTIFYFLIFLVIRLVWLLFAKKRRTIASELLLWVFVFYLILLFSLTVFRDIYFPTQIKAFFDRPISQINFQPLSETFKLTNGTSRLDFIYNFLGNILWFIPLGILLPSVSLKKINIFQIFIISFVISLTIETLQFILWTGVADVDDLIFNILGGVFGYLIYRIFRHR